MKICSVCSEEKSESQFFYRNKKLMVLHAQCKDCYTEKRRKAWREHYHKYGSQYRQKAVARNRRIKAELRKRLLSYLQDKKCQKCDMADYRVLEFDHIDPTAKSFEIARAINSTVSWFKILDEIEKCQILCANCHKIKTAEEQGWYKNIQLTQTDM